MSDCVCPSPKYAKIIMLQAHKDQTRWDGRPYSVHPEKVVEILQFFGITDNISVCAAYLHDVLEDTNISEKLILDEFGKDVLDLVKELTFEDGSSDEYYIEHCADLSNSAMLIKIADILANITDKGHKSEHFLRKRVCALQAMLATENRDEIPKDSKQ